MRLWSKGLGKLILPLDLNTADMHLTPDDIIYSGVIREGKINWEYTIKMSAEDLTNFTGVLTDRQVLDYLAQEHGVRLLGTVVVASVRFLGGLVRTLLGRGEPVVPEEALGLGLKTRTRRRRPRPRPNPRSPSAPTDATATTDAAAPGSETSS